MARVLWQPSADFNRRSNFARYLAGLERGRGLHFSTYRDAWAWSCAAPDEFWASLWDFFQVKSSQPYEAVLTGRQIPGTHWFPGARLNYAQHVFRNQTNQRPALLFSSELRPLQAIAWDELHRRVGALSASLRAMGVRPGDRVAAYLPNIPEAVIGLLACASIGAVWSSCSPDFGAQGVIERFQQIEPRVLFAVDGYSYGGQRLDRRGVITRLRQELPSLQHTVLVPYLDSSTRLEGARAWPDLVERQEELTFEPLPFEHPLWVLYSSGTTGLPKAIVHGHGGILLEHLKALALQNDMRPEDRFFWFTTTGWMMWNLLIGGLLVGCTVVLYDGSPAFPHLNVLWQLAQDARITRFGGSAGYFTTCMKAGLRPADHFDLRDLRAVGSTGSPLPPDAFPWIYDAVKRDVWLAPTSGGTDVCSSFVGACPFQPVREGEMQGPQLGVSACAFDAAGRPVVGEVGELVITQPMPSMPLFFWNDPGDARYRESYFEMYPGVWRHGDWVRFTKQGGAVIYGRSDSTLNRQGVRIGTSEIYRAVEALPEVVDSLVIGLERTGGQYYMPLFVVLRESRELDEPLRERIRQQIRSNFTPRHVPDDIIRVDALPRTLSGKKVEVPIKRILTGEPPERVVNAASLSDPQALDFFAEFAMNLANQIHIRDARNGERAAIRQLTTTAYAEYEEVMTPSAWAALAHAVDQSLDTTEPVERMVALRGPTLVGSVMLYSAQADAYAGAVAQGSCPELRLLAVAHTARGQGVGAALVRECARRARRAGALQLGLHTSASMRVAIQLYERIGFVRAPAYDFQPPGAELVTAYRLDLTATTW
ncbi:MAG: acetoacetate--CoA ligase [Longimicrobiales bacterium]